MVIAIHIPADPIPIINAKSIVKHILKTHNLMMLITVNATVCPEPLAIAPVKKNRPKLNP